MKTLFKISSGLVLLSLLALPFLVSADVGPGSCCVLKGKVNLQGFNFRTNTGGTTTGGVLEAGTIVGDSTAGTCGVGTPSTDTPDWGIICLLGTIYGITNWIFVILMGVAVIFIIVGGFFMVTAAGNPEQFGKGRQLVIYAIIGMIVALAAKYIPSIARFIIGV